MSGPRWTDDALDGLVQVIHDAARGGCGSHQGCRDLVLKKQRDAARRWLIDNAAREAAAAEQARAEVVAAHGVAWQDRLNIICLCGAVCSADMGKSPAPLMGSKSDYYVRTPAAQRFAQHLRDTRAALATEPTP